MELLKIVYGEANGYTFIADGKGNPCTTYDAVTDDNTFTYYVVITKGTDSFWLTNFWCFKEEEGTYLDLFKSLGETITVE